MKREELKKQMAIARRRAIEAHPVPNIVMRERRLMRFIGALEILAPDVAAELVKVWEGDAT